MTWPGGEPIVEARVDDELQAQRLRKVHDHEQLEHLARVVRMAEARRPRPCIRRPEDLAAG